MYFRLENKESHKSQEIGNLIRAYNRSKREEAESEPLNLYVEDEKGNLLAGLIAETFGNWLEIETVVWLLSILTSFKLQIFIKVIATRKSLLCKTIPTQGKDITTKRICDLDFFPLKRS